MKHIENIRLREDHGAVAILDQSLLPSVEKFKELETPEEMYEAIQHLRVRGAPAIGIFVAYCMYVLAKRKASELELTGSMPEAGGMALLREISDMGRYLKSSRPTAVNLAWAVERTEVAAQDAFANGDAKLLHGETLVSQILQAMKKEAINIHQEDQMMCKAISEYGLTLIKDGDGILTHCNAGPLATSQYGTALGPILLGKEQGMTFHVYADETRPLLQGARLTAYELQQAGVKVTLICDNMASAVMKNGWIQACFVGCDRVAANGDTANKIGTSGVAVLARHYGIPFYVLGPTSTIDLSCPTREDIPIELRDPREIRELFYEKPMAPDGVDCYNPAFDVTDHQLITAIVTEKGICRPPFESSLKSAVDEAERERKESAQQRKETAFLCGI